VRNSSMMQTAVHTAAIASLRCRSQPWCHSQCSFALPCC
jgi:hypothetical protein